MKTAAVLPVSSNVPEFSELEEDHLDPFLDEYLEFTAEQNSTVQDAITGNVLDVDKQTIHIGMEARGATCQRYVRWRVPLLVFFFAYVVPTGFTCLWWYATVANAVHSWGETPDLESRFLLMFYVYCVLYMTFLYCVIDFGGKLSNIVLFGTAGRTFIEAWIDPVGELFFRYKDETPCKKVRTKLGEIDGEVKTAKFLGFVPIIASIAIVLEDGRYNNFFYFLLKLWFEGDELLASESFSVGTVISGLHKINNVIELGNELLGRGNPSEQPSPNILIRAKAGTGKTWSARQLARVLSTHPKVRRSHRLVPLLIFVQQLARDFRLSSASLGSGLEWYIKKHYEEKHPEWCSALLSAHSDKRLLIILDGVDEAAELTKVIERYVLDTLVAQGHSVVITSRYEGVRVDLYPNFVILDLKPLSKDEQHQVILSQTGDLEYFHHLIRFSEIRSDHDKIYREQAFPLAADRDSIESINDMNRFQIVDQIVDPDSVSMELPRVTYDMNMVQRAQDGRHLELEKGELQSKCLKLWCSVIKPEVLRRIDKYILEHHGTWEPTVEQVSSEIMDSSVDPAEPWPKRILRLMELCFKFREPATDLWPRICQRTDQLYVVAEDFGEAFGDVLEKLCLDTAGEEDGGEYCIEMAPVKTPIRIYEKARDDYFDRFPEEAGILPEASVTDIIRARIICKKPKTMLSLIEAIQRGYDSFTTKNNRSLEIVEVRLKSKFSPHGMGPAHFRNILVNIRLLDIETGMFTFGEIQLHHMLISSFNKESRAHDHYEYFRSKLRSSYDKSLGYQINFLISTIMNVFEDVVKNPVLLSLLTVVLSHIKKSQDFRLPSSKSELYKMSIHAVIESHTPTHQEEVLKVLQRIAFFNMIERRRVFTLHDAKVALEGYPKLQSTWETLLHSDHPPPLIKILVLPNQDNAQCGGEYQFSHLSFQEYLFASMIEESSHDMSLPSQFSWGNNEEMMAFFRDKFYNNLTIIAPDILAKNLFCERYARNLNTFRQFPFDDQMERLGRVLETGLTEIETLCVGPPLSQKAFQQLETAVLKTKTLKCLKLKNCIGGGDRIARVAKFPLEKLDLEFNGIDADGALALAQGLALGHIKTLDVRNNSFNNKFDIGPLPMPGLTIITPNKLNQTLTYHSWVARSKLREAAKKHGVKLFMWLPLTKNSPFYTLFVIWLTLGFWLLCLASQLIVNGSLLGLYMLYRWVFVRDAPSDEYEIRPSLGPNLVLVKKGSANQFVFSASTISALQRGEEVSLDPISHPMMRIGLRHLNERRYGAFNYIESMVGLGSPSFQSIKVKLTGSCLELPSRQLVLDIAFGRYQVNCTVNFVRPSPPWSCCIPHTQSKNRHWTINSDGTISAKYASHLVLGSMNSGYDDLDAESP